MAKGKMKMLHLIRIFSQETDDEHALTLQEIIGKLAAVNITADRKTLYNDFEDLRQFGFDIIAQQRDRTTYYHLGERDFELPELKLLVDSVQAAKFITTRKSRELIRKLERYTCVYQAAQLHRQVYIAGRVKAMNESIFYNIDRLHSAINAGVQIRFQYSQWNLNKEMELRRNTNSFTLARKRAEQFSYDLDRKGAKPILVLNLANPVNPGGGVRRGAKAQEEDLCRKSSLLVSLESAKARAYYDYNRSLGSYMGSHALMIHPQVEIIKDENGDPLPETVIVAVMTCAAPMLKNGMEGLSQEKVHHR